MFNSSPFGMMLPGRNGNSDQYRYGFQNQEIDNEIKGNGNSVNYKYRMHDPRIGRFFAVDPLTAKYAYNSPYAFSENRVLDKVELEGLETGEIGISASAAAAGVITVASAGMNGSIAMDLHGNIALTTSGGLSAFVLDLGIIGEGISGAGTSGFGADAGVEIYGAITNNEHVTDLSGEHSAAKVGWGVALHFEVQFLFDENESFEGIKGGVGLGVGALGGFETNYVELIAAKLDEWKAIGEEIVDVISGEIPWDMTPNPSEDVNPKDKSGQIYVTLTQNEDDGFYYISLVQNGVTLYTVDSVAFESIENGSFATPAVMDSKE